MKRNRYYPRTCLKRLRKTTRTCNYSRIFIHWYRLSTEMARVQYLEVTEEYYEEPKQGIM
jgi:hypothetical protein